MKSNRKYSVLLSNEEIKTLLMALDCRIMVCVNSSSLDFQRLRSRLAVYANNVPPEVFEPSIWEVC